LKWKHSIESAVQSGNILLSQLFKVATF